MKVLIVNKFLYPKGGDAICALETGEMLSRQGHEVAYWGMAHPDNPRYPLEELFVDHVDYDARQSPWARLRMAARIVYSFEAKAKIRRVLDVFRPDIVHVHNFAHQISPSILDVLKAERIPAVMTMHDYKLICAAYGLAAPERFDACEPCLRGRYVRCLTNKCIKDSRAKSLIGAVEMALHHKVLHVYDHLHTVLAPSSFMMELVRSSGYRGRIAHVPNGIDADRITPRYESDGRTVAYVGRLIEGKGLPTLVEAFKDGTGATLTIIGDGPLRGALERKVRELGAARVVFLGHREGEDLAELVGRATVVVMPSEGYENNPRAVIEAMALGKPVVGARIGGIPELVRDNVTGLTFRPGDAGDLKAKVHALVADPDLARRMGREGRALVEAEYSNRIYYRRLMSIYEQAVDSV